MSVARWSATLDDYEANLHVFTLLLADSQAVALPPFAAPYGLGPLPAQYADRARSLLQHSAVLLQEMQSVQEQTSRQLLLVARTRTDQASPAFVDARL